MNESLYFKVTSILLLILITSFLILTSINQAKINRLETIVSEFNPEPIELNDIFYERSTNYTKPIP